MQTDTSSRMTDEQLALYAASGCRESFEELVRRFQVPLFHFLSRRMRTVEDAEDIAQEAFVRAYENMGRYRSEWRFSTWLFTIASRLSISHARKKQLATVDEGLESVVAAPDTSEQIAAREMRDRLWDLAEKTLDPSKFTALWLFYVEEMPVVEIAKVLGASRVAVRTMLFRARKRLLPALAGEAEHFLSAAPLVVGERKIVVAGGSAT